jgi:hypothetical protein
MSVPAQKPSEAINLLRRCLSKDGAVYWGSHFAKALADENLTFPDAWQVLRNGRVYAAPEPDIKTGDWKYRIEGNTPDGIWLAIIFCFREIDRAFLITAFSVKVKRKK